MINLLPPQQKEELLDEEKFKLILILGIVFVAFLLSLALMLLLIKISLSADLDAQKIYFEQREKELDSTQIGEIEKEIQTYNLTLSKLKIFYQNQLDFTLLLEKIAKTLPEEVYLTGFNFNSQNYQISLNGFSPDRQKLLQLKENLAKTEGFKDINFSSASWVPATDISFSVNFTLTK